MEWQLKLICLTPFQKYPSAVKITPHQVALHWLCLANSQSKQKLLANQEHFTRDSGHEGRGRAERAR